MANLPAIAADGVTIVYLKSFGTGTEVDPFLPSQTLADDAGNVFSSLLAGTKRTLTVSVVDASGNQLVNFGSNALTDTQLRASPLAVTGTFFQATQPVSLVSLPALATGSNVIGSIANTQFAVTQSGTWTVNTSLPRVTSGTILSLTTNATGSTYTAFTSQSCTALDLVNNTGTTIEYRRNATGTAMQLPDKSARLILGITNANQVDVRRTDTSNTQVSVQAEGFVL